MDPVFDTSYGWVVRVLGLIVLFVASLSVAQGRGYGGILWLLVVAGLVYTFVRPLLADRS